MSVVARQGFKYSVVGYLGFLLGTFSAIFVFPYDMEFYGKLRYVLPTAEMLLPIVVFGISFSNVKFFTKTHSDGKHQNFLSLSLAGITLNFIIFTAGYFAANYIFPSLQQTEMWQMKRLILPLILVLAFSTVFNKYLSNFKRIVIPNIFENLLPKLANLGAFCLFFFLGFPEKAAYAFFVGMFVVGLLGYVYYTNRLERLQPDFSIEYIKKDALWKQVLNYSFYGFLGNIGNFIAVRIDSVMIGEYIGFEPNGVYNTLYSIISLITVPAMGLYSISAPLINKHLAENELEELDRMHKKSSLVLFFLGLVLLSCVLVGFPYLTHFIKNGELLRQSEPVIWVLGFAMLFDLATGFNGHIISLSKYYRFNIIVMLFLAITTVSLNFYFISNTNLELLGIAIATAISLTLFNIAKISFNYWKFRVFPLTIEMIYALIIGTLGITLAILLPSFESSLLNLFYKPAFVLTLFLIGNYFLKIFPLGDYLNKDFLKSLFKF
ncbi:polysaccharide biosynthesis protein [Chryseobacterium sp. 6424]|uniref:lipopolysaccharide biosynthesis protein n=1 Tax=Chryseobacterium sp. 6424 TaxID=2039166 RepID=UPI000EFAABA7|nr:oligosaccharide flippase family protein [Chryseobacterium sp. 6424]AYO58044.1 polysaccharide biosynthesis protein [Chryseobacterium sp. 6424]